MSRLQAVNEKLTAGFIKENQPRLSPLIIPDEIVGLCLIFYHVEAIAFKCDPNCIQRMEPDPRKDYVYNIRNMITTQSKITKQLQSACISNIGWNGGCHQFEIKVIEMSNKGNAEGFGFGIMNINHMGIFDKILDYWHVYNPLCLKSYQFHAWKGTSNGVWTHQCGANGPVYNVADNDKHIEPGDNIKMVIHLEDNPYIQCYINNKLLTFGPNMKDRVTVSDKVTYHPVINIRDQKGERHKFEIVQCI